MKREIKDFINANVFQRRAMVLCGFELETQSTDGMKANDEGELDEDSYYEAISEARDELLNELPSWLDIHGRNNDSMRERIEEIAYEHASESVDSSEYTRDSLSTIRDQVRWGSLSFVEVVKDGSVEGFEFRTVGGLKYLPFAKSLTALFKKFDHEIDDGCSFHVHLSIPGIKHQFGTQFQIALNEYIIEHQIRLPESVRERFKGAPNNQYISGLVGSKAKYSFTHAHHSGTWEFRCFGNVQSASEGMACLNLAIEAMAYAYEITHARTKYPITHGYSDSDIQDIFAVALHCQMPVSQVVRKRRSAEYQQNQSNAIPF